MNGSLKIEFINDDSFTIYYITDDIIETEEEYKVLFKYLNDVLEKKYNYFLHGYYDVNIYVNKNIYVMEFNYIDDYGRKDFNVTIFLNSMILYEFEDNNLIDKNKIYYNNNFYVGIDAMIDDIRLFEYGNIVYGKIVDKILNKGILIF